MNSLYQTPIIAAVQPGQTPGLYPVLFRTAHGGQYTCYAPVVSTRLSLSNL